MRQPADRPSFEDWASARWPVLVGSARARTGATEDEAQRAVVTAISSVHAAWGDLRDDPDLDARVLGAALHVLRPDRHPRGDRAPLDLDQAPDPDRGPLPRAVLEADLARDRAARRRRRRRLAGAALVGVVVVVALLVAVAAAMRPLLAPDRPQPPVSRVANPVPAPWWADGVLHLDDVRVELGGVRAIAEDGDDIVFEDGLGYGRVDPEGEVEWTDRRPAALDEPPAEEVSGYRLTRIGPGEVGVIDDDGSERVLRLGADRRVDAMVLRPGGVAVLAVSLAPESLELRDFRRLSQTGPVLVEACDLGTLSCRRVATVTQSSTALLPVGDRRPE